MLEHYALEDDPLEAFKQRQSQLEQVGLRSPPHHHHRLRGSQRGSLKQPISILCPGWR